MWWISNSGIDAGQEGGRIFHDLRRTGLRNLKKAGVDRRVAMQISGHRTESVHERYAIGDDDDIRDAAEKVSAYVATLPTVPQVVPIARRTTG